MVKLDVAYIFTRLARFATNGFAAIGFAVLTFATLGIYSAADMAAWYRTLPVVVAKHCPGASK
jgi:hypothetical protein